MPAAAYISFSSLVTKMRSLVLLVFCIAILNNKLVQCTVSSKHGVLEQKYESPELESPWERLITNKGDVKKNYLDSNNLLREEKKRKPRQTYPGYSTSNPQYNYHSQPNYNGFNNTSNNQFSYPRLPSQNPYPQTYPTHPSYPTNIPISPRPPYQTLPSNSQFLYNSNYSSSLSSVSHKNPNSNNYFGHNTQQPQYNYSRPLTPNITFPNQQPNNYGTYPQFTRPNVTNPSVYNNQYGLGTTPSYYANTRPQTYPGYGVNKSFGNDTNQRYPNQYSNSNYPTGSNNFPGTNLYNPGHQSGPNYPNYNPIGNLILNGSPPQTTNRIGVISTFGQNVPGSPYQDPYANRPVNNRYNSTPIYNGQGYQYSNNGQNNHYVNPPNYNGPTVPYPGMEPNHFFHNPANNTPIYDPRKTSPQRFSY